MPCESFFRDILGVSDGELLQALSSGATLRSISKGEHLMEMGDTQTKANFLVSGVVRCFSLDAEGRETTDCLISVPGSVLVPSADLSAPAPATVEMLTDGEVVWRSGGPVPLQNGRGVIEARGDIEDVKRCRLFLENDADYFDYRFVHPLYREG